MSTVTARVGNQFNFQSTFFRPPTDHHVNNVQSNSNNNTSVNMRPLHSNITTSGLFKGKTVNNFEPRMDMNAAANGVKRSRSSPSSDDMSPAKCLKVNTSNTPVSYQHHPQQQPYVILPRDEVITPGSATNIDIQHFDRLAIDLVEADESVRQSVASSSSATTTTTTTPTSNNNNNNSNNSSSPKREESHKMMMMESSLDDSYDGFEWLGTGPSTKFFPLSSFIHSPPRSPFESDDEDLPEVERLRRENEELRKKLAAVSQIAIDTILNQPKVSEVGMTSEQLKQSRKEAVAAVAAACGISKSRAQKEAKRRWLESKDNEDLVHHYKVTTNNKTKRTIIGILKKRNEIDLVKDLKKDLKKKEIDA